MAFDWLKLFTEARTDVKLSRLTEGQHLVWFNLLCLAGEQKERGVIEYEDTEVLALEVARGNVDLLTETLPVLAKLRIVKLSDGRIEFINWAERQGRKDDSKDRVRRYRDRRKDLGVSANGYIKYREEIYARDGYACVYCGSAENLCIDHTLPTLLGGGDEMDNLATACKQCNSGKAGRTPEMAGYAFKNVGAANRYRAYCQRVTVTAPVTVTQSADLDSELDKGVVVSAREGIEHSDDYCEADDAEAVKVCAAKLRAIYESAEVDYALSEVKKQRNKGRWIGALFPYCQSIIGKQREKRNGTPTRASPAEKKMHPSSAAYYNPDGTLTITNEHEHLNFFHYLYHGGRHLGTGEDCPECRKKYL